MLGNKYSHLQHELLLMVGGATLNMVTSTLWTLECFRRMGLGSWLYIPLTLGTQIASHPFYRLLDREGVLTFNLCSLFPVSCSTSV